PEQIVDYLALVGDTSDNIPGVPKVGPKTAAKWLNEYGTLDNLVANADAIAGKVGESLRASLEDLELSRKLATLDCDVSLTHGYDSLVRREPNRDRLRELYTRLELRSHLRQLGEGGAPSESQPSPVPTLRPTAPVSYETITTLESLRQWIERLRGAEAMSLYVKASSNDYMQADLIG